MAKLNISNKNKPLPILRSFKGARAENFISCQLAELVMNQTYYYDGDSSQPVVGDSLFNDINGTIPFSGLRFIQYKVDANNRYYLKLNNNKIVSVESCQIVNFTEFDALEQTSENICTEDGFYPDNLTNNAETFYHDGKGEFPVVGDKIYLSKDRFDTLENFSGLFNILNGTYYYLFSNNLGVVTNIKTCKEIIKVPVRSSKLKAHRLNEDFYNIFLCKEPEVNISSGLYYKQETEGLPEEGNLIYSDSNLDNLVIKSSYYVSEEIFKSKNEIVITSLLVDEEGKASYTTCTVDIFIEDPIPNPDPILDTFYFNVILGLDFCEGPNRSANYSKLYYEDDAERGANFVRPRNGTKVYLDEQLTQPYNSLTNGAYAYLYRDYTANTLVYALFEDDEIQGTRSCNDSSDLPDGNNGGGISEEGNSPQVPEFPGLTFLP